MAKAGEVCPKCGEGRMRTITSRLKAAGWYKRWLRCTACNHPDTSIVAASDVWRRKRA